MRPLPQSARQQMYRWFSTVDPDPVMVIANPDGEDYVRIDGSKVKAVEVSFMTDVPEAEPAYRQHRKTCGGKP